MNHETLLKIIKSHHHTERAFAMQEHNVFTFKVVTTATKPQIKAAVEKVFNVSVLSVKTMVYKPVSKRTARGMGSTKSFKKAMVRLAEGSFIDPNTSLVESE